MSHTAAPKVLFVFDCDGTLVNSTPVWAYAQPEFLHRHGVDVTVDDFAQFEHLSLEDECQPTTTRGALARMARSCIASLATS